MATGVTLPEGWVAVFRWNEQVKCIQHVAHPNRTACGGRRQGKTCQDAGVGWLVAESSPEAAAELGRREWCGGCVREMGGGPASVAVAVEPGAGPGGVGDVRLGGAQAAVRIESGRS
jgi:hypothetical protein